MGVIEIKSLYFSYDKNKQVLKNINFSVKEGEIVSILGPNGSGKTTLLKCINLILYPTEGEIYLNKKNIFNMERNIIARNISYVPQEHKNSFPYSVLDVILMGRCPYIGYFSSPKKKDLEKCYEVIEFLGINHLSERIYTQLSGGEKKLCLIARALATESKVMLLDEPTTHLDLKYEAEVLNCIKKLGRERDVTIIMNLHNPNLVFSISDRVILLKEGEIVKCGRPEDIITEENIRGTYCCNISFLKHNGSIFISPEIKEKN